MQKVFVIYLKLLMNDTPWSELGMTLEERKGEYACEPSDNQEKNCP